MADSRLTILCFLLCGMLPQHPRITRADESQAAVDLIGRFCVECHSTDTAAAGVNFTDLSIRKSFARDFRVWQRAVRQLEDRRMPPAESSQLNSGQRGQLMAWIRNGIKIAAGEHEGEPGDVVIRRLTSAEYGYAIHDLTGIDMEVDRGFVGDAAGGAGFTNTGIVQFTQDSVLEQYLAMARRTSEHVVVGTGPLTYFRDPGRTGFELSAIHRIQDIYRNHGFRSGAGEGGEAFGQERYSQAFLAAWKFQHRRKLGCPESTLDSLSGKAGIDSRFSKYIYGVLTRDRQSFPTTTIVNAWRRLPEPDLRSGNAPSDIQAKCEQIARLLRDWQNRFGANTDAKEEAPVLRADVFLVKRKQAFEMNVNWPPGTGTAHLVFTVESANRNGKPDAVIAWKDPKVQFRDYTKRLEDPRPLREFLTSKTVQRLKFGIHPRGGTIAAGDFVTTGTMPLAFELPIPDGARSARILVTGELDVTHGEDCIVRCTLAQLEETDQGKSVSGLLASPDSAAFETWKAGVLEFARILPQMSHREPAPSDRDPVPAPIDATYNNPERNFYHTRIKYFRDDEFLVRHILDRQTRLSLDQAWADLRNSFGYYDTWLELLDRKYSLGLDGRRIDGVDAGWIAQAPESVQRYLRSLRADYERDQSMFQAAESGHLSDVVEFATRAWRRPLSLSEQDQLTGFYRTVRKESGLDHRSALVAVLSRVLVSPKFLYRSERAIPVPSAATAEPRLLSQWELASRMSFLVWSSVPDAELRRAASAGELATAAQIAAQLQRMLQTPESRRFAAEFFGQWFGFYRFHQFRGIDSVRFPEFTDSLRRSLHTEAVEFFDFVVRHDRPVHEILNADYTFVNRELALHYGLQRNLPGEHAWKLVRSDHRGGILGMGAILAATSAPRRTSPVKRGDWILRRVLGTAVPPPPADAGSIAADEVVASGLSIRQRLLKHRRDAACHHCHSRFDALGFALENYDPLGRWRQTYRDQTPVENAGVLDDGTELSGEAGLRDYLTDQRIRFYETTVEKLVGYALGRQVSIGDQALVARMNRHMQEGGGIPGLLEDIVTSRQFRYHAVRTLSTPGIPGTDDE